MVLCKTGFIINQYGRKSEMFHKFNETSSCLILTNCVKWVEKRKDVCTIYVYIHICIYIYIYIHIHIHTYIHTPTHTHTHTHIYIYIYVSVCVCMHVCVYVCVCRLVDTLRLKYVYIHAGRCVYHIYVRMYSYVHAKSNGRSVRHFAVIVLIDSL